LVKIKGFFIINKTLKFFLSLLYDFS